MSHFESQALVVMYPDRRTTGDVDPRIRPYSSWYQRIKAITDRRLGYYSKHGLPVIGVTYEDTLPDNMSPFFSVESFHRMQSVGRGFDGWNAAEHKAILEKLVLQLNFTIDRSVIVTGFHLDSCVLDMEQVLQSQGFVTQTDVILTEHLPSIVADNEVHKIQRKSGLPLSEEIGLIDYLSRQHGIEKTARLNEVG